MGRVRAGVLCTLVLAGCAEPSAEPLPDCRPVRSGCPNPVATTFVDPVRHLGRGESSTFIEITDVVVDESRVWACTGVRGAMVWDHSSEAPSLLREGITPIRLSDPQFPRCQHIGLDADARRMVLTNRGDEVQPEPWVALFDVTTPESPRELAQWWEPDVSVEGAIVEGENVYLAGHTQGVWHLRLEGDQLVPVGSYRDAESDAWQVVKTGDVLVAAEGATGLRTYRLAGGGPQLLATVPIEGSSRDVVLHGDTAYVAASASLAIVDLSNPAAPRLRSETPTRGTALAVSMLDAQTVVVAEWDEIRGYDVSEPDTVTQAFAEVVPTDAEISRVLALDASFSGEIFGGEWQGLHQFEHVPGGTGPDISISPQAVQFGAVDPGDSLGRVVVIRNEGDQPLTITDVVGPSSVGTDTDCLQIPGSGAAAIEVTYTPETSSELSNELRFCSDDPDEPHRDIVVTANVEGRDVGDPMPEFTLQDTTGQTWSSSQLEGNVVVLAYFATF